MDKFVVRGGNPLRGTVTPSGNKNAALPILAATLLTDCTIHLRNIPDIDDVQIMLEILTDIGAEVVREGPHAYAITAAGIRQTELNFELCRRIRASILFAGPMLARCGGVRLGPPGGDIIGRRRIDTHLLALQTLGVSIQLAGNGYEMQAGALRGTDVFLDEASVTGTENAIMAAVLARGRTIIRNAASEPHVQDLARFLTTLGARIEGIGSNTLVVDGVDRLGGGTYEIIPDHIEVASFVALAAVTGGELLIKQAVPEHLHMTRLALAKLGVECTPEGADLRVAPHPTLRVVPDVHGAIPKIDDGPWPAFPADLISIATVVATQAEGTVLIFEKMFESRMFFVDKLIAMGASLVLCDPHRVVVVGRTRLHGEEIESPDIRAGMSLLIASLCAEGTSVIHNIRQIDRGYERMDERLRLLGADIERVR